MANNKKTLAALLGAAVALATGDAIDAAEEDARKAITAPRLGAPPVIDGRLDEAAWSDAAVIDDLTQIRPTDGGAPSERTEVLVAYDADNLYIAARMYDTGAIIAGIMRQGSRLAEDDRIAIILDPFNSARTGYRFEVNLNSVRNDMLYQGTQFSGDWTVIWQAQSQRTEYGWSAEIAIPFKTLPFDAQVDAWGFNVSRAIRRKGEEVLWVSRNRTWNPSIVGELRGLKDVDQGVGLDVVPSMGIKHSRDEQNGTDTTQLEPSLDAYYRITPSLNGSLTVNTDFSATELDDRQVNLTRFGLFFPEKRDFFLNDSDLFEFGRIGLNGYLANNRSTTRASQESGRPFFSRRLGLSPLGAPVDVDYGGKLSGRIGRWRVGALAVQQDDYDPFASTPAARLGRVDAKMLGVLRVSADVLRESSIGFIGTSGDPGSNLTNSLYGFDFLYLNSHLPGGRSLEAEAWYQKSATENVAAGREDAWGVGFRLPNSEGWRVGAGAKQLGVGFRPAQGFVNRRGVRDYTADLGYTTIFDGKWLQSLFAGVDAERIETIGGELQTQIVTLRALEVDTRQRDLFRGYLASSEENLLLPFVIYQDAYRRVVVQPGHYRFADGGFDFEAAVQRRWAGHVTYRQGEFYDGNRLTLGGDVIWRPSRYLALKVAYTLNDIDLPTGSFSTRVLASTAEVNFSSRLSWITLMQYDNVSEIAGLQSRLQWVPRAGQKYFLVANHGVEDFDKDGQFHGVNTEISVRAGYTFRF